jgi:hypothetical protein
VFPINVVIITPLDFVQKINNKWLRKTIPFCLFFFATLFTGVKLNWQFLFPDAWVCLLSMFENSKPHARFIRTKTNFLGS